ncbi:MAG: hypothetical protein ACK5MK_11315 [Dysgonomonas sp.]
MLRSFNLKDGSNVVYADSIPFTFNDVSSFCTLYYNKTESELYAVVLFIQDHKSIIKIYSLSYPPLKEEDIREQDSWTHGYWVYLLIILFVGMVIASAITLFQKRKKAKNGAATTQTKNSEESGGKTVFAFNSARKTEHHQSSILFLGGFQVWDKTGKNITKQFTPILKQLLALIILYNQKNEKGISNVTLREFLWPDKSEENAQNNRRVNIHKLRSLMETLDGIQIDSQNAYWNITFSDKVYCDYMEVYSLLKNLKQKENLSVSDLNEFPMELLTEPLLPFTQAPWLDSFKAEYSNTIIDEMVTLSKQESLRDNNDLMIVIADIIFAHDKTDEYALSIKCRALNKIGKIGIANNIFNSFCAEYKSILDIDYPKSLKDII